MKKLFFSLLVLTTIATYTQTKYENKQIDSLLEVLQATKEDTTKVTIYHSLCELYRKQDLNKLQFYNDQLLKLTTKINYERGLGFYYYHLTFINEDLGKDRVASAQKAAAIFLKVKDEKYFLKAQYYLANALLNVSKYKEAKKVITESLPIVVKKNLNTETGSFYRLLGLINYYEGKLDNSLKYYKKALFYYHKEPKSTANKSELYLYMAFTYTDLEQYKESIQYLDLANSIEESIDINIEKAVVLNKMLAHKEALEILLNNRRPSLYKPKNVADYNTYILADTYYHLKEYDNALVNLKTIKKDNAFFEFNIEYYNLLANCYLKLKQLKEAKSCNDKALSLLTSSNISGSKQAVLLTKSKIEEQSKNFEQALFYYKKQAFLKESYNAKITKDKVHQLQMDFEVTEKNNRIKSLHIKQLENNGKIKKQRTIILIILFGLVLTCISILVFIKVNVTTKKKNQIIEKTNKDLEKSIAEKNILLKEIHHRVKNNLQLVMSLLYIQSKQKQTDIKDFLEISQSRIISMALIHENLYQTKDLSKVDFKDYIAKLMEAIKSSNEDSKKEIQLKTVIEEVFLDIQTAVPLGLIINELVNNAYKHAFKNNKKGTISLLLQHKEANTYTLEIKDDGAGVSESDSSKKTLGLELVKQLVSQIHGQLTIESTKGLQYHIQFKNIVL